MTEAREHNEVSSDKAVLFDAMPLCDEVKRALADMGYTHPTPVQSAVYEAAAARRDLVVQARTGTGKTAAFGIPLIDQLVRRSEHAAQALVLTPTRELAIQVAKELGRIAQHRNVSIVAVYGGAPMQRQIDALRDGAQIVVGTPGRVLDHLRRATLRPEKLATLVLDESDEMLSMGFERELNAIVDFLPEQRQTLLFSATLPPEIVRMAQRRLHDAQFLYLSGDNVGALEILHFVYMVLTDKTEALRRIIEVEDPESALIFCNTKDETERVASMLQRVGFDADWLNGDLPQSDRERVMARSKEGKLRFLVATDVAARGIDISHLTHVINFDFPESSEVYVHRTGRTGRMGRTGTAINLITPHDIGALYYLRLSYKIRPFEKRLPTDGELQTRAHADTIAMLDTAFGTTAAHPEDIALARRLLTHDNYETILANLLRGHLGDRTKSAEDASEARRARLPEPAPAQKQSSHPPRPKKRTEASRSDEVAPNTAGNVAAARKATATTAHTHARRKASLNDAPVRENDANDGKASAAHESTMGLSSGTDQAPQAAVPGAASKLDARAESRTQGEPGVAARPALSRLSELVPKPLAPPKPLPVMDDDMAEDSDDGTHSERQTRVFDLPRATAVSAAAPTTVASPRSGLHAHQRESGGEVASRGNLSNESLSAARDEAWIDDDATIDAALTIADDIVGGVPQPDGEAPIVMPTRSQLQEATPLQAYARVPDATSDAHGYYEHTAIDDPTLDFAENEEPTGRQRTEPEIELPRYELSFAPEDNDDNDVDEDASDTDAYLSPGAGLRSSAEQEHGQEEVEIFVTVGRRDGVRPGDFLALLEQAPGVERQDIGRIRIRDRNTFVGVQRHAFEQALKALHGRALGGRIASAQRARPREE